MYSIQDLPKNLQDKISLSESGCWVWVGSKADGYGKLWKNKQTIMAHCVVYVLLAGQIPDGSELDHLCRNRACVNPDHLEPVTHRVNILRGTSPAAINARKTHCPQGHEYTPENTYRHWWGGRVCRTCRNEKTKIYKRRGTK